MTAYDPLDLSDVLDTLGEVRNTRHFAPAMALGFRSKRTMENGTETMPATSATIYILNLVLIT